MTLLDLRADRRLVVLGAGIIGTSIAARAAEHGRDVVLLSAEAAGSTAVSRASFAWVNAHDKSPAAYSECHAAARLRHRELSERHPTPWFVHTGAEVDGVGYPEDGYVDVHSLLAAQLDDLRRAGGHVHDPVRVESLDHVRRIFGADTAIIVAAGAATAALIAADSLRVARLGSSAGLDGFLARIDVDEHPVDRVRSIAGLQARPDGPGRIAVQSLTIEAALRRDGIPATVDSVWSPLREEIRRALDWSIPDGARVTVASAARPVASDGLPVIGALSEDVYVALTHSGVTLAPLIAELVARDLHGDTDPRLLAFRPERSDEP